MPAQNGGAVLLQYGPQGERQSGGAILLDTVTPVTTRRVAARTRSGWGTAAALAMALAAPSPTTAIEDVGASAPWQPATAGDQATQASPWGLSSPRDDAAGAPWSHYSGRAEPTPRSSWIVSVPMDDAAGAPWGRYEGRAEPMPRSSWLVSVPVDDAAAAPWGGTLARAELLRRAVHPASRWALRAQRVAWSRIGRIVRGDWTAPIPVHEGPPEALVIVPIREVYMQVNTATLRRVEGNVQLRPLGLNLSLSREDWVWTFSATLPPGDFEHVEPIDGEPTELEAEVNGNLFRVIVESISTDRQFGRHALQVRGRGITAQLDAPYSPALNFANTADRTLQQIMGDVLTDNGASLGWTVNFAPDDWLIPAGVFSHRGSYISALNTLAQAAGAYVQPHATDKALSILRQYPAAPWEWAGLEPDYELPSALMTREAIEWLDKPRYNAVFVSGVQAGIVGHVKRVGSAADLVAPTITDPLMATAVAARQRGLPVLADVGRQAHVTLRFPVLTELGLVKPGALVRYVDGGTTRVGLARSINIEAGLPAVWQSVKLETHHEPV